MASDNAPLAQAERAFRKESARYEKGSAMLLIAEETKASEDKTARLKRLRLAHEATIVPEAPKPARRVAKRTAGR